MGKQSIVFLGLAALAACAGQRHVEQTGEATTYTPVEAAYTCASGPILVISDARGRSLVDGSLRRVVPNWWSDREGDHFLSFERVGADRRPVAYEYVVPRDRGRSATVRTYDRSRGSYFKVTARPKGWRIAGEPSEISSCGVANGPVAVRDAR